MVRRIFNRVKATVNVCTMWGVVPLFRECRKEEVGLHDIFRALPNPTDGLDEERIASITGSVQAMGQSFRKNAKLMEVI